MQTIVIDPGHGGETEIGDSSPNNSVSASGVLEKNMCLDIARRMRFSLQHGSGARRAEERGIDLAVVLTRETDTNLGLADRAQTAADHDASLYLSLHCNGFDGTVQGTECWIDRKYMQPKFDLQPGRKVAMPGPGVPSSGVRNLNVDADAAFAKRVVDAAVKALGEFDSGAKLRSARYTRNQHGESYEPPKGVKMQGLGTLRDAKLGTGETNCRAALLELEFIDHPKVDHLLNGGQASQVRNRVAGYVAVALVDAL